VTYRLNLYCNGSLASTQLIDAPLEEAKAIATHATDSRKAHRAEITDQAGSIIFQRWAVL
jgi:hypothetical protein